MNECDSLEGIGKGEQGVLWRIHTCEGGKSCWDQQHKSCLKQANVTVVAELELCNKVCDVYHLWIDPLVWC